MVDWSINIDFDKYRSFFLAYYRCDINSEIHIVRPCTVSYDDIVNRRMFSYTLDGAVLTFTNDTSLSEIMLECAIRGIRLDFIDIYVKNDKTADRWKSDEFKILQTIDTHKEDITKYLDEIEAPRHYVTKNRKTKDVLKFLVIDRFSQGNNIKFFKGQYDNRAIVAGFNDYDTAISYCEKINSI